MKTEENESKNMGRKGIRHIIVYSFSNQREQHITYMHATTVDLQLLLNTITKQTARSNTQSYGKLYYVLPELFNNIPRASVQLSENGKFPSHNARDKSKTYHNLDKSAKDACLTTCQ